MMWCPKKQVRNTTVATTALCLRAHGEPWTPSISHLGPFCELWEVEPLTC